VAAITAGQRNRVGDGRGTGPVAIEAAATPAPSATAGITVAAGLPVGTERSAAGAACTAVAGGDGGTSASAARRTAAAPSGTCAIGTAVTARSTRKTCPTRPR
jgi:hypothetical protein